MPFYPEDYLRDTLALPVEGHGAYLLLIIAYWLGGEPLNDDDEALATIARMSRKQWEQIRPLISRYFSIRDHRWHHKRIDKEIKDAAERIEALSVAGRKRAKARWRRPPILSVVEDGDE